jgi:hypothetical protein
MSRHLEKASTAKLDDSVGCSKWASTLSPKFVVLKQERFLK